MKEIEVQARGRTGRRCPQGPDLGFTKPTRDSFQMLHFSFAKIKSILDDKGLLHIAEEIDFSSFTTLQVEHFFAGMRTPSRPTPDMHDYASRRPNCIIESLQKTYQSSFVVYSGPQSHYIENKVHEKEPEWLYERCKSRTVHTLEERDETREEAKELRLFAKEFGQGVRQQRVRGKTQERAGTLPLAISMMKRIIAPETRNLNMLEELQGLEEESGDHLDTGTSVEKNRVIFSKGEVVALKHNYRTYLEPFFLAILCEDLHSRNDCFLEEKLKINWLEQSEEDPLVYNKGTFDDQNSPKCIMDRVSVDREAEQFILRRNEERRLRNLAHGHVDNVSDDSDDESQEEENLAEVEDEEPSSRSRCEAGHSRSGRRVTRYLL